MFAFCVEPAGAQNDHVERQLIVHFKDDVVAVPNRDASVFPLEAMVFQNSSDALLLETCGVEAFCVIAKSWRYLDEREVVDLHGEPVTGLADFTNTYVLELSASTNTANAREEIAASGLVHYATFSAFLQPHGACTGGPSHPTESSRYDLQWALHNDGSFPDDDIITAVADVDINLPEARAIHAVNTTKIAVLDTGIRASHEDIQANFDFGLSATFAGAGSGGTNDQAGHGTASGSIAAGVTNNGLGVASPGGEGVIPTLVSVKVAGTGTPTFVDVIEGMEHAVTNGIPVLSMSLGYCRRATPSSDPGDDATLFPLRDATRNAFLMGHLVVASTGNPGLDPNCAPPISQVYPAGWDQYALGVGRVTSITHRLRAATTPAVRPLPRRSWPVSPRFSGPSSRISRTRMSQRRSNARRAITDRRDPTTSGVRGSCAPTTR